MDKKEEKEYYEKKADELEKKLRNAKSFEEILFLMDDADSVTLSDVDDD